MSKFTLVQDSSQISAYFECPTKWNNHYNKRLEPLTFEEDEAMNSGTYGHKLLDIYYRYKAQNLGLNDIVERAFAYDPDKDVCECGCSKDYHCPLVIAPNIEECKKCKKCTKFRAHPFALSNKSRNLIRKRFRDYCAKYQRDDIQPASEQYVEVGFSEPIYEDSENLFVLEGRIDVIGTIQGLKCFMDHKFQTKTHWLYPKSIQFKNYMLIAKVPMAVINYVRLQEKIQPDSLYRDIITLNQIELEAWRQRLVQIYFRIKKSLQSKEMEKDWSACSGYRLTYDKDKPQYCWYTNLCETIDPKIAEAKEKQLFKVNANPWKPW